MSYDLTVSFEKWPDDLVARWRAELTRMGVELTFDPEFDPRASTGWCPVWVTVADEGDPLPLGDEHRELGAFENGFEYYPDEAGALFSAKSMAGNAVAVWCAAALAAITGGTFFDPQCGLELKGATGGAILKEAMKDDYFQESLCGPDE